MAFALAHATKHSLRRVIVVIPFLSIIEQNAGEYRSIFGTDQVVEHHSGMKINPTGSGDPAQASAAELAAENWDAPIIVTTSVQFLESLFAASPSRCRKLHNIAQSVVVLDEVQTFPTHLLEPVLNVLRELRTDYGVSFLFCSATQPAFRKRGNLTQGFTPAEMTEIAPEPETLFRGLERVAYHMPSAGESVSWEALAEQLIQHPQALCVVNTRRHALTLWREVKCQLGHGTAEGDGLCEGLFHLSASMCAEHRLDILGVSEHPPSENIRRRLRMGLPCRVISTQLVEAGVDIDFPVVFRAVGPLDSLVQAAGRCNREGRLTDNMGRPIHGEVFIFHPTDPGLPRGVYSTATTLAEKYMGRADLSVNPQIFADYFDELFGCLALDHSKRGEPTIQADRCLFNFRRVAEKATVIDDAGSDAVIVPYGDCRGHIDRVRNGRWLGRRELRNFQRFMVNMRTGEAQLLKATGSVQPLLPGKIELWVLDEKCYRKDIGVLAAGRLPSDFTF